MSKYRLSDEEIEDYLINKWSVTTFESNYGFLECQNRLIPLLEEKDQLLRECRAFLVSMMGAIDPSPEKHGELLNKLKDI